MLSFLVYRQGQFTVQTHIPEGVALDVASKTWRVGDVSHVVGAGIVPRADWEAGVVAAFDPTNGDHLTMVINNIARELRKKNTKKK